MAIINGSLYSEGEQITPAGSASVLGFIARVDVDRVVVKLDGSPAELSYWTHGSTPTDHPQQVSLTPDAPSAASKTHSGPQRSRTHRLAMTPLSSASQQLDRPPRSLLRHRAMPKNRRHSPPAMYSKRRIKATP